MPFSIRKSLGAVIEIANFAYINSTSGHPEMLDKPLQLQCRSMILKELGCCDSLQKGLFTGGISRISKICKFSRISRKWSDSPLFSTLESLNSLESLERRLF